MLFTLSSRNTSECIVEVIEKNRHLFERLENPKVFVQLIGK